MHTGTVNNLFAMAQGCTVAQVHPVAEYLYLLSNCISYCTESTRNEYKYPTMLYSTVQYSTVRTLKPHRVLHL